MSRRSFIRDLIAGKAVDRPGLWIGKPHEETIRLYCEKTGAWSEEELHRYFDDDLRWITPHYLKSTYRHPRGLSMRYWKDANPHGMAGGLLACASTTAEVDDLEWPEAKYLNFNECLAELHQAGDYYRLSGFWSPFFHDLTYLFGTEELLLKLMLQPEVVHRALEKLCHFYLEANEIFYRQAKGMIDAMFFGNDFGIQSDLLMAPEQFDEFFLPWIRKFAEQAHEHGLQVVLHSCGSIYRIMDRIIGAGVDAIHPIQAKAENMNAACLATHFKGKIAFVGGIDMQKILTTGTAAEVYDETRRVIGLLGNNIIVGPSHEALLPDVPFENVVAMCNAARGIKAANYPDT